MVLEGSSPLSQMPATVPYSDIPYLMAGECNMNNP